MSAETLQRAAALMREQAEAIPAPEGDDLNASWSDEYGPAAGMNALERAESLYIASWHPAVALAVADWLDAQASVPVSYGHPMADGTPVVIHGPDRHALAVARAYLGESA